MSRRRPPSALSAATHPSLRPPGADARAAPPKQAAPGPASRTRYCPARRRQAPPASCHRHRPCPRPRRHSRARVLQMRACVRGQQPPKMVLHAVPPDLADRAQPATRQEPWVPRQRRAARLGRLHQHPKRAPKRREKELRAAPRRRHGGRARLAHRGAPLRYRTGHLAWRPHSRRPPPGVCGPRSSSHWHPRCCRLKPQHLGTQRHCQPLATASS